MWLVGYDGMDFDFVVTERCCGAPLGLSSVCVSLGCCNIAYSRRGGFWGGFWGFWRRILAVLCLIQGLLVWLAVCGVGFEVFSWLF